MQHMLSLGGIDVRFIRSEFSNEISALHANNNVTGNSDGLGERGFINLGNVSGKNNDDFNNVSVTATGIKDAIYTSDGFLKSIMFISWVVLPILFSELPMPVQKTSRTI